MPRCFIHIELIPNLLSLCWGWGAATVHMMLEMRTTNSSLQEAKTMKLETTSAPSATEQEASLFVSSFSRRASTALGLSSVSHPRGIFSLSSHPDPCLFKGRFAEGCARRCSAPYWPWPRAPLTPCPPPLPTHKPEAWPSQLTSTQTQYAWHDRSTWSLEMALQPRVAIKAVGLYETTLLEKSGFPSQ